jgi:hypothetical protein
MSHLHFHHASKAAALALAVVGFAAMSLPALAEQHVLSGTHSKDEINKACDSVGGIENQGAGGNGYGCYNPKNGTLVACNNGGVCTGYTPGRIVVPTNLRHLLHLQVPATSLTVDQSPAGNGISKGGEAPASGGVFIY